MATPSISIIIPTIGRWTLDRTLESIRDQLGPYDEVLVVGDGPQPEAKRLTKSYGFTYIEGPQTRCWGHAQRNLGMSLAEGDYLAFMDDDDFYLPGAFEIMREAMRTPAVPLIFRMFHMGRIIWENPEIKIENVSTQMFLFPNRRELLGVWGPHPENPSGGGGDYCFARDTVSKWKGEVVFEPYIIARLVDHAKGRK